MNDASCVILCLYKHNTKLNNKKFIVVPREEFFNNVKDSREHYEKKFKLSLYTFDLYTIMCIYDKKIKYKEKVKYNIHRLFEGGWGCMYNFKNKEFAQQFIDEILIPSEVLKKLTE